ncbi:hypothetical protein PVK06_023208 [Gossypium arboreum]|uniref:Uncharacterized protein n=1 Tax=Gossypium arboreum TaxID=29729 RepID=A0ABR0PAJ9_GOSAR|nr:hypothetical protein PVK06_023208 [Gossypium arboreum]
MRKVVLGILGVRSSSDTKRFLGLPNIVEKTKKRSSFQVLNDRFKKHIDNWSVRHLSQERNVVFIKVVLQAIPTYTMTCFLLLQSLCDELESIIAIFLWQKGCGKRVADRLYNNNNNNNDDIRLVSDLINETDKTWKTDMINNTFYPDVARKILQISLAQAVHEDIQIWQGESSGEFTVKSAYKLLQ